MSDGIKMQFGGGPLGQGFTIKSICGCRIVFGAVPASEFSMLTHGFSKKALMATDIANLIGASFVIGEPADLDDLRKMDLPVSEKRHADYLAARELGLHRVAMWLRKGERGSSSNAMCNVIFGVPADGGTAHPHDPDDLRRCLLLLDATEARDKVLMMACVSPEWSRLVERWSEVTALFAGESAAGKSAPRTLALMQEILK